jgi:branched-subunit amino acid ABC-type transport system permease component
MLESLQFIYAPQIINGLSIGVAVILMALGTNYYFGLLDVINMSHGEFYACRCFSECIPYEFGYFFLVDFNYCAFVISTFWVFDARVI